MRFQPVILKMIDHRRESGSIDRHNDKEELPPFPAAPSKPQSDEEQDLVQLMEAL